MNRFVNREANDSDAAFRSTQSYKNALMAHVYAIHTVAQYANHLAVSQPYLNRCLQLITGKTAHHLLDEMLLLEAKTLLKQTRMGVREIAYKIGKQDHSDFSRFYQTTYRLHPEGISAGPLTQLNNVYGYS